MTALAARHAGHAWGQGLAGHLWSVIFVAGLALAGAVALATGGVLVLGAAIFPAFATLALARPYHFAIGLLGVGVAIEPNAIDATEPLSRALYEMPAGIAGVMPFTTTPLEILIALTATGALLHAPPRRREGALPVLVWAAPLALVAGTAFGWLEGGEMNIAWNEMRGLVFGMLAFAVASRMAGSYGAAAKAAVLWGSLALAIIVIGRHAWFVVYRDAGIPSEFLYAHEDAVLLGIGFVVSTALLLRAGGKGARTLYGLHSLLLMVAMMASGRRAAILVLLVGAVMVAWLLLPRRPLLVLALGLPAIVVGGAYLSAYWDTESGVLAQPARAVRSQIDPSDRDRLSDDYRRDERHNIAVTLDRSPLLGVGFGVPFDQEVDLPELDFWPLQFHTPHQNVLWLWLKMGLAGAAVFLGLWLIGLRRCLAAFRAAPAGTIPVLPLVLAASLMMYLFYASVDVALVTARSTVPLAVVLALALRTPPGDRAPERGPAFNGGSTERS